MFVFGVTKIALDFALENFKNAVRLRRERVCMPCPDRTRTRNRIDSVYVQQVYILPEPEGIV